MNNRLEQDEGSLAIPTGGDFGFGFAPKPVACGRGLAFGSGSVVPEINFTLPPLDINDDTWPEVRRQYEEVIAAVCRRAVELEVPGMLAEFETLHPGNLYGLP